MDLVSKTSWLLACSTRWRLQNKMASASAFRSARRLSRPTEDASGSIAATPVKQNSGFRCRSINRKCSSMPSATIFVIDDHAAVRDALGEMLSVFGYAVKTYESADGFLHELDQRNVGCVVADVRMPGTDGLGLVRELARRNIALPVILISGHADVPMAVAAIKSGAEDFIEKPVDDAQLVAAINRALARRFEQQESHKSQHALHEKFARLTPRQVANFDLMVARFTSHAISAKLTIIIRTVESYRAKVMEQIPP